MTDSVFENPGVIFEVLYKKTDINLLKIKCFQFSIDRIFLTKIFSNIKVLRFLKIYLFFTNSTDLLDVVINYLDLKEILQKKIFHLTSNERMRLSMIRLLVSREKSFPVLAKKKIDAQTEDIFSKIIISKAQSGCNIAIHAENSVISKYMNPEYKSYFHYQVEEI